MVSNGNISSGPLVVNTEHSNYGDLVHIFVIYFRQSLQLNSTNNLAN